MSMLCDICQKKEANFFFKAVVDNKSIKFNLCENCAKEKGIEIKPPFQLMDIFSTLADFGFSLPAPKVAKKLTCRNCGLSYDEFREGGKLGCEFCYDTFSEHLDTILEKMYGTSKHELKAAPQPEKVSLKEKLNELRLKLQEAIRNEEYEKAAKLRDQIKELEKEK